MTADPRVEVVARALLDVSEAWPRTGDALDDAYLARKYARAALVTLDEHDHVVLFGLLVEHAGMELVTATWDDDATLFDNVRAIIEAALRERIAREIEAATTGPIGRASGLRYIRSDIAARIARGES